MYPIHDADTGNPYFISASGITYYCIFEDITDLSPIFYSYDIHIYEFSFFGDTTHLEDEPLPVDFRIMRTIANIIHSFLEEPGRVVAYRCDYSDSKQGKRQGRFDREYERVKTDSIIRETAELVKVIGEKEYSTFAAILYRNDFEERKLLKDYFTDIIYQIVDDKYSGGFFSAPG